MTLNELVTAAIQILPYIAGFGALYIALRKQPAETKVTEAAAASAYIDNQSKLMDRFTTEAFDKLRILTELGELKADVIHLTNDNLQLKADLDSTTKRAVSAEKRADAAETALVAVSARVDGYPALIEDLRSQIDGLKKAASENSSSRLADANTRENDSKRALINAQPTEVKPQE